MKLYIEGENHAPSFSVYESGRFLGHGGGFYLKSDDGSLSLLQTWTDADRKQILRKLKRIVAIFNMEESK